MTGGFETADDDFHRREGTHAVMNGHHALGIVGYQREGILDTEKALTAAVGYRVVFGEMMLLAEMVPIVLLILWQYEDDF